MEETPLPSLHGVAGANGRLARAQGRGGWRHRRDRGPGRAPSLGRTARARHRPGRDDDDGAGHHHSGRSEFETIPRNSHPSLASTGASLDRARHQGDLSSLGRGDRASVQPRPRRGARRRVGRRDPPVGGHGRRVPVHQPRHDLSRPHREHRFALRPDGPFSRARRAVPAPPGDPEPAQGRRTRGVPGRSSSAPGGRADRPRSTGTVGWSRGTRRGSSSRTGSSFRA